jgi:hypothetical protein
LVPVFSLGSLNREFQTDYILSPAGGSLRSFHTPELIEKLQICLDKASGMIKFLLETV